MSIDIKTSDTAPPVEETIEYNGEPFVLTDYDVFFVMENYEGETIIDAPAVKVDATEGKVEYQWKTNDLSEKGTYLAEFKLVNNDVIRSYPNDGYIYVNVHDSLRD